jgi:ATP-dependent RNA helicase DeaD
MQTPTAQSPDSFTFDHFSLDERIIEALVALGFSTPTPIQAEAIPHLLEGRDVVGRARTGSGKTAAFGLPLLHRMVHSGRSDEPEGEPAKKSGRSHRTARPVRAVVLAPTRELALQVTEALRSYATKLKHMSLLPVYGGAAYEPQLRALREGVDVVIGTPGRVLDHLQRGTLDLSAVEMFVLDEADEMLRMGFIDDVEQLLAATPEERQVVLFSATMPPPIRKIAAAHLKDPVEVQVERSGLSSDHIEQRWMLVNHRDKAEALARVLRAEPPGAKLIFTRTRQACSQVADALTARGVAADAIHGDLSQAARERVLRQLRTERLEVLVGTDVAARGLDVEHLTHVINYDLPGSTETYVHRIGRTGRAGRAGKAISLVMPSEVRKWHQLERQLKRTIEEIPVPSDADIARQQRTRLQHMLQTSAQDTTSLEHARAWALEQLQSSSHTMTDLAASAIATLARQHEIDLAPIREEKRAWRPSRRPPSEFATGRDRDRDRPQREAPRGRTDDRFAASSAQHVELTLSVGRSEGVSPSDIVGALANELGISGKDVGKITMGAHRTYVGVSPAVAGLARKLRRPIYLRGHEVRLDAASPHTASRGTRPQGTPTRTARTDQPRSNERSQQARFVQKRDQKSAASTKPMSPSKTAKKKTKPARPGPRVTTGSAARR